MRLFGRRRCDVSDEASRTADPVEQPVPRAGIDVTVADLLGEPVVREAVERAPTTWRSCVDLDYSDGSDPFGFYDDCVDLMGHVWLSSCTGHVGEVVFEIGLGDELAAYVDLQADPDPVSAFLEAHPSIDGSTVGHDNDERFTFTPSRDLAASELAVIAVDALAAGHVASMRAAGLA